MAEGTEPSLEKYQGKATKAFIVGYTGEVGKALVQHLAKTKPYEKVFLLGRREVPLHVDDPSYFEQKTIDFEKLEESADILKDVAVGFCALGTTRTKAGTQGFIKVDYDYVVKTAKVAKASGCQHFSLVSSQFANKNSSLLYFKTKGQAEDAIKALNFRRYSIYRPAILFVDRQEWRPGEFLLQLVMKPWAALFPGVFGAPVTVLAKAMVDNTLVCPEDSQNYELFENKEIHHLADIIKTRCSKNTKVDSAPGR